MKVNLKTLPLTVILFFATARGNDKCRFGARWTNCERPVATTDIKGSSSSRLAIIDTPGRIPKRGRWNPWIEPDRSITNPGLPISMYSPTLSTIDTTASSNLSRKSGTSTTIQISTTMSNVSHTSARSLHTVSTTSMGTTTSSTQSNVSTSAGIDTSIETTLTNSVSQITSIRPTGSGVSTSTVIFNNGTTPSHVSSVPSFSGNSHDSQFSLTSSRSLTVSSSQSTQQPSVASSLSRNSGTISLTESSISDTGTVISTSVSVPSGVATSTRDFESNSMNTPSRSSGQLAEPSVSKLRSVPSREATTSTANTSVNNTDPRTSALTNGTEDTSSTVPPLGSRSSTDTTRSSPTLSASSLKSSLLTSIGFSVQTPSVMISSNEVSQSGMLTRSSVITSRGSRSSPSVSVTVTGCQAASSVASRVSSDLLQVSRALQALSTDPSNVASSATASTQAAQATADVLALQSILGTEDGSSGSCPCGSLCEAAKNSSSVLLPIFPLLSGPPSAIPPAIPPLLGPLAAAAAAVAAATDPTSTTPASLDSSSSAGSITLLSIASADADPTFQISDADDPAVDEISDDSEGFAMHDKREFSGIITEAPTRTTIAKRANARITRRTTLCKFDGSEIGFTYTAPIYSILKPGNTQPPYTWNQFWQHTFDLNPSKFEWKLSSQPTPVASKYEVEHVYELQLVETFLFWLGKEVFEMKGPEEICNDLIEPLRSLDPMLEVDFIQRLYNQYPGKAITGSRVSIIESQTSTGVPNHVDEFVYLDSEINKVKAMILNLDWDWKRRDAKKYTEPLADVARLQMAAQYLQDPTIERIWQATSGRLFDTYLWLDEQIKSRECNKDFPSRLGEISWASKYNEWEQQFVRAATQRFLKQRDLNYTRAQEFMKNTWGLVEFDPVTGQALSDNGDGKGKTFYNMVKSIRENRLTDDKFNVENLFVEHLATGRAQRRQDLPPNTDSNLCTIPSPSSDTSAATSAGTGSSLIPGCALANGIWVYEPGNGVSTSTSLSDTPSTTTAEGPPPALFTIGCQACSLATGSTGCQPIPGCREFSLGTVTQKIQNEPDVILSASAETNTKKCGGFCTAGRNLWSSYCNEPAYFNGCVPGGFRVRNCNVTTPDDYVADMIDENDRKIGTCSAQKWKPSSCPNEDTLLVYTSIDFDGLATCWSSECTQNTCPSDSVIG